MKKSYLLIGAIVLLILISGLLILAKRSTSTTGPDQKAQSLYKSATSLLNAGKLDEAAFELQKLVKEYPDSDAAPQALFALSEVRQKQGTLLEAKTACERIIAQYAGSDLVKDVQKRLGDLNIQILFSPTITDQSVSYEVKPGDTLTSVAKRFNTTIELLKRSNSLKSDYLRPKMQLKVHTGKFSVVVDKLQNTLILKSNEDVFKVYAISTGKETSITPTGNFKIVNKLVNPVWYTPGEAIPPTDPRNILGSRWMGFDKPGYGIHGTTEPQSIGRSVTAGCVRMYNKDVEELFDILPTGTDVVIID